MSTRTTVHLLRHGEVHNPDGILYGRLPGFRLSADGLQMAHDAAEVLRDRDVAEVVSSPLQRAQETAGPLAAVHGLEIVTDDRLLEATNVFEGSKPIEDGAWKQPRNLHHLRNPFKPSWGEPYAALADRVLAAARDARDRWPGREVVCVSHQLPIYVARRRAEGRPLWHRPDRRQCGLASLTSFTWEGERLVTVTYSEPGGLAGRRKGFGA